MPASAWRVGSRGSRLARVQTGQVIDALREAWPDQRFVPVVIRTTGDRDQERPLAAFGETGVFVKEIERALLAGEIDLAVHSAKDVPTTMVPELAIAAYPKRGPAHDVLITRRPWELDASGLPALREGATVATSSVRRAAQLKDWRSDLRVVSMRGNVETRVRKLFAEDLDAIVLAAVGLWRLGWANADAPTEVASTPQRLAVPGWEPVYAYPLPAAAFVPAAGQGALAVQIRRDHTELARLLAAINHLETERAVRAERAFMAAMGASCEVPIGAHARVEGPRLRLSAFYSGAEQRRQERCGPVDEPERLGRELAEQMLRMRDGRGFDPLGRWR